MTVYLLVRPALETANDRDRLMQSVLDFLGCVMCTAGVVDGTARWPSRRRAAWRDGRKTEQR